MKHINAREVFELNIVKEIQQYWWLSLDTEAEFPGTQRTYHWNPKSPERINI